MHSIKEVGWCGLELDETSHPDRVAMQVVCAE